MYTQGSPVEIWSPAYWSLNAPPLVLWPSSIFPPSLSHFTFIPGRKLWHKLNNIIPVEFQPVYHTIYTSPTACSNQYNTPSTHHLQLVPTSIPHRLHFTYSLFQPVYHTVYTSPTDCSNQYTTPSTHHLHTTLNSPHHLTNHHSTHTK